MSSASVCVRRIEQETKPAASSDTVLGMFADEPELLDEVVDAAMHARENG